ncbi:22252_t:CDS:2 [Rhizophagus irregularis]|nr:22252_t:CDS:2 [Rhizophagus irregularis]
MALRVVSEYFTKMKKFQKMQAYIIYMQFICCIACLVQDALFFAELREIEDVIDRSKFAIGFEAILWIIYVILKLLTWNGTTVAVLYFLGLLGPGGIMHYLGTVIFGIVNLFLYIICYTLNGTSWTNEIIE